MWEQIYQRIGHKSSANNVRIEPLPNYLREPRKQTCSCLIGCRTGVEPFRTHADRGHVLVKKKGRLHYFYMRK